MSEKPHWSPDSWVKVILVSSLVGAFVIMVLAMAYRSIVPKYGVTSEGVLAIFENYMTLFGVVVGYVLGARKND